MLSGLFSSLLSILRAKSNFLINNDIDQPLELSGSHSTVNWQLLIKQISGSHKSLRSFIAQPLGLKFFEDGTKKKSFEI